MKYKNKLLRSKKGLDWGPALFAILTLIIFSFAAWKLLEKSNEMNKPLGDLQYKLLNTYDNAERIQFYIDESAKRSASEALYDLAKNGGIATSDCDKYFGSTLLVSQYEDCMPKEDSSMNEEYLKMFDKRFKIYLSNYPYATLTSEYDLNYYEGLLVGISQNKIVLPITTNVIQQLKKPNETIIKQEAQTEKINSAEGNNKVVEIALSQVGKPYSMNSGKPEPKDTNPHHFDCAGFTGWVFGTAGASKDFTVPSLAAQQYNIIKTKHPELVIYDKDDPTKNSLETYKKALNTPGVLLVHNKKGISSSGKEYSGHAALTLGDGKQIIEAGGYSSKYCKDLGTQLISPSTSCVAKTTGAYSKGAPSFYLAAKVPGINYATTQPTTTQTNQQTTTPQATTSTQTNTQTTNTQTNTVLQSYNFEYLISDEDFTNIKAATQAQIQQFLEKKNSGLKNAINGELPSKMIYDVGIEQGINPIVLLTTLQKEKTLIGNTNPSLNTLDWAMGCGCHDGKQCNPQFQGFKNQISCSAKTLKTGYEEGKKQKYPYTVKNINYGGTGAECKPPNFNKGPSTITVKNAATYSLYRYTPHTYDLCRGDGQTGGGNKLFLTIFSSYYKQVTGNEISVTYSTNELTTSQGEILDSVGAYSFTPAFEMDLGYDFTIYKKIYETMIKLNYKYNDLDGDAQEKFVENIIDEAKKIDTSINWFKNCETPNEKMYYSFAEQYDLCAKSNEDNCYCEMKITPQTNLENFNFIISTNLPEGRDNVNSQFLMNGDSNEVFTKGAPGIKSLKNEIGLDANDDVKIKGKIENSNLIINIEIPNSKGVKNYEYTEDISKPFFMYKEKINEDNSRLNFINPETYYDSVKKEYEESKNTKNNYKACKIEKNTVKLCVNPDKKLLVYDKTKNDITTIDNTIKFAYTFKDSLPPLAIYDIIQNDSLMLDKSVILKFTQENKYDEELNFKIYYSKENFEGKSLDEIKNSPNITTINLENSDNEIPNGIDIFKQDLKIENSLMKNDYTTLGFEIEKNKVYAFENNDVDDPIINYATKINFDSNEKYYILITASDSNNNELGVDSQKINYKEITVKDTLAPATIPLEGFLFSEPIIDNGKILFRWSQPTKNIDGSNFDINTELKEYRIYYAQSENELKDNIISLNPSPSPIIINDKTKTDNQDSLIEVDLSKNWCFYVVPVDTEGNMQFNENTKTLIDKYKENFFEPKCITPIIP